MKKIILILLLTNSIAVKGTELMSAWDFQEIYNLYFDQQYEVVKAKMKSYGYILKSEVPPYNYNNVYYMGEFTFTKKYKDIININNQQYEAERTIEFKFKACCENSIINSKIDFTSETSQPAYFFVNNLMNIWVEEIKNNRTINTEALFDIERKMTISDTTLVCGKKSNNSSIIICRNPSKDYRIFLEKGNNVYSKFYGFVINNKAKYPTKNKTQKILKQKVK